MTAIIVIHGELQLQIITAHDEPSDRRFTPYFQLLYIRRESGHPVFRMGEICHGCAQ